MVAGVADEMVQISYAIGVAKPVSIFVNTYGTSKVNKSDGKIAALANDCSTCARSYNEKFGLKIPFMQPPRPMVTSDAIFC